MNYSSFDRSQLAVAALRNSVARTLYIERHGPLLRRNLIITGILLMAQRYSPTQSAEKIIILYSKYIWIIDIITAILFLSFMGALIYGIFVGVI